MRMLGEIVPQMYRQPLSVDERLHIGGLNWCIYEPEARCPGDERILHRIFSEASGAQVMSRDSVVWCRDVSCLPGTSAMHLEVGTVVFLHGVANVNVIARGLASPRSRELMYTHEQYRFRKENGEWKFAERERLITGDGARVRSFRLAAL